MTLGMIKYHLLVLAREPLNIFFGFGLPFLQLFIFSGTMDTETRGEVMAGALPIFITVASMVLCFTDSALSHGYTRQIKFLRRLRMTPVKPLQYIFTGIASRVGVLLLFAASFIAVSVIFFDLSITDINWALFVGVLLLAFIMFYLIGMFVANALKNAKGSQSLTYVVFFGLLAIGGIFFPIEVMP
ncbi:MAG: ABC transporter permease, partial [Defluviitaleaceae bacterium]|nr:ABC transporter permease [Defluviitaleaceae bacterium]